MVGGRGVGYLMSMLLFRVFEDGQPAQQWALRNAYLLGNDGNAIRAEVQTEPGRIVCEKRDPGSAALSLLYPVGEVGEFALQTCLLPESDEPYLLSLELARHRMMLIYTKEEDWSLFGLESEHPAVKRIEVANQKFLEAVNLQHDDPTKAHELATECLVAAVDASEELALEHSQQLLERRRLARLETTPLGVGTGVALNHVQDPVRNALQSRFDFLQLPTPWRALSPEEGEYKWNVLDVWADWAKANDIRLIAGPLVCFEPGLLPDWLYIWEHDYDTVRDRVYEHIEKIVERYGGTFQVWNVASGLHINQHFQFAFDQLMDLTRMSSMLIKKLLPAGRTLIELRQPFGEYYAHNQRSIPPMTYIDLIQQSALDVDAYALRLPLGQAMPGQFTRDLMQVSAMLDQFAGLNKPLYLTLGVPSETISSLMLAAGEHEEAPRDAAAGHWRRPWDETVQAHWLEAVFQVALSKPFVEAVAWTEFMDHENAELPLSGLVTEELAPKEALRRLSAFRQALRSTELPTDAGVGDAAG